MSESKSPSVSVIMPSLNVGEYIEKSLASVMAQSLRDIEIICVDAGSSDGTLECIEKAASEDSRVRLIKSEKKSYGFQMNLGIKCARGKYIGIIETDDFAEPLMYEKLLAAAERDSLDAVKAGFWLYYGKPKEKNIKYALPRNLTAMGVFSPTEDFYRDEINQAEFFNIKPSIWSGIYGREFLGNNSIRFSETGGAAFQDTAFNFKVWACAQRVRLIPKCFVHYRQDNEGSSVNSRDRAFSVCGEYKLIEDFINERFPENKDKLTSVKRGTLFAVMVRLKYDSYLWNIGRLEEPLKNEFIMSAQAELGGDMRKGYARREFFLPYKWEYLKMWIDDPASFAREVERSAERSVFSKAADKLARSFREK